MRELQIFSEIRRCRTHIFSRYFIFEPAFLIALLMINKENVNRIYVLYCNPNLVNVFSIEVIDKLV